MDTKLKPYPANSLQERKRKEKMYQEKLSTRL